MKKNYFLLICLGLFIVFSLTACKGDKEEMLSEVPDKFVPISEITTENSILDCIIWETQISFVDEFYSSCIYQTDIDNRDYVVKNGDTYYVNKEKYSELEKIAALARETRKKTYDIGDMIEILGKDQYHEITITEVKEQIVDGKKIIDIKYSAPDIDENDLRSIFAYAKIRISGTYETGLGDILFVDSKTVRLEMKPDRELNVLVLKSPEYPGLEYKVRI